MGTIAIYTLGIDRTEDSSYNGHDLTEESDVATVPLALGAVASSGGRMTTDGTEFRSAGGIVVEATINLDSSSGDRWIAACEHAGEGGRTWWKCGVSADRGLFWAYDYDGGHEDIKMVPGILPSSGWTRVRFLRAPDGLTIYFYVSGLLVGMATAQATANGGESADLIVMNDAYNLNTHRLANVTIVVE